MDPALGIRFHDKPSAGRCDPASSELHRTHSSPAEGIAVSRRTHGDPRCGREPSTEDRGPACTPAPRPSSSASIGPSGESLPRPIGPTDSAEPIDHCRSNRSRARKVAEVGFDFGADEKKRAPDLSRFRKVRHRRYPPTNRLRTLPENRSHLPDRQVILGHFSISFLETPVVPARRSCRSRTGRAFANRPIWEGLSNISALAGWLGAREDVGTGSGGKVGLR